MNEINDNSNETKEVVRSHHQKLSSLLSLFEFSFIVPTENKVNMLTNTQVGSPLILLYLRILPLFHYYLKNFDLIKHL